ncbi:MULTISPECIES: metal ABC transporter substrate-binding protein [unclassified Cyanobium]|uniref:metal ABC transporter substrate-binding protein n=1 Tax=unclassified Cyanobium TaxID=2627006 RepID=UPI0020CEC285|nr:MULTISPECIES: metal ABC transporter substrate-binding protein [unclassified Cyanobium]MCP9858552.1 metal ABC transporter substrate-binding protein [Cyanobium sp. Cruz-8H5]MCP9865792.1 metal ABC transporter substrate-binding protein [Cyanobium sp. Cruz-8D1]
MPQLRRDGQGPRGLSKRLTRVLLGTALVVPLLASGCARRPAEKGTPPGPKETGAAPDGRPLVLTTFTILADMTRQVAGERVRVESITRLGDEVHGYEPTPSDLKRASGAQMVLENGFGLERWAQRFYASLRDVPHVPLTAGITPLPIASDAHQGQPNPHAWMSPRLAKVYVENIRLALTQLDPAGAETFRRNAERYNAQLDELHRELQVSLGQIPPRQRVLATCEGAFSYLARDYGLTEAYLWPVNAESQITPQRMARLIALVKERQVPAVFCESTVSAEAQKQVARQSGARFGGVFHVDSLSLPDGPAPNLLEMQRHNVRTLQAGLAGN